MPNFEFDVYDPAADTTRRTTVTAASIEDAESRIRAKGLEVVGLVDAERLKTPRQRVAEATAGGLLPDEREWLQTCANTGQLISRLIFVQLLLPIVGFLAWLLFG